MHGDGAGHGAGRAVLAAGGLVAALARVVLLLDEVVARAERHQVRVVRRRRDRHRARAAHVRVAQLVRQALQLVRPEVVVVPEHVVVGGPRRTLRTIRSDKAIDIMAFKKQYRIVRNGTDYPQSKLCLCNV